MPAADGAPRFFQNRSASEAGTTASADSDLLNDFLISRGLPAGYGTVPTNLWQFLGPIGKKDTPFIPFEYQLEILLTIQVPWPGLMSNARPYPTIFAINAGRRVGKTTIAEKILWTGITAPDDDFGPPTVRVTADTEEHARKIWDVFIWHLFNTRLSVLYEDYNRERQLVTLKSGATAQLISSHNPNSLSGDGVTLWLIDEAQYITQAAWDNLFPSTAERNGVIVALGVSEGEGPFREISFKGNDRFSDPAHSYPEYCRLSYPTAANPRVPRWRIELAARDLSPVKFKQLYLAQWANELGAVFRNVEGCVDPKLNITVHPWGHGFTSPPIPGNLYYGGIDLARLSDWTVFTIWDRTGTLVAWDRFSLISWDNQKDRLARLSALYGHPFTYVDTTGVGDPIFDELIRANMNVVSYKISSNDLKRILIDELAIRIGGGFVRYPRIRQFLTELNRFEAKRREGSSVVRYEAPSGVTDDMVLSAALAQQALPRPKIAKVYNPSPAFQSAALPPEPNTRRQRSAAEWIT